MSAAIVQLDARRDLAKERARALLSGRFTVYEVLVGGDMGLDLSTYRCSVCEGKMPPVGRALIYYDEDGHMLALHRGEYRSIDGLSDLEAWADDGTDPEGDRAA